LEGRGNRANACARPRGGRRRHQRQRHHPGPDDRRRAAEEDAVRGIPGAAPPGARHQARPVSRGSRRRGRVPSVRRQRLHHRPDAQRGRRHVDAVKVFDTDAHVEECDETFAALPADIRPRIIEGEKRAFWLIEGRTFPRLQGKGVHTFGSPHLRKSYDAERRTRAERQELRDPTARLQDMDHEGIDLSVVSTTMFLVWPLADDPALVRALCRSYNEWIATKCKASGGRIRWVATLPLPDVEGTLAEVHR